MKINPVQLTEQAWERIHADLEKLLPVMDELYNHFGAFEPFADGSEWTPEKAAKRLLEPGVLTPVARAIVRAWQCVQRSLAAAMSERERWLALLIPLATYMEKVIDGAERYQARRSAEVKLEAERDGQIGWETIHSAARERLVASKIGVWLAAMKAAYAATVDLCTALHEERPPTLEARTYSGNGTGSLGEFAMRLIDSGIHPNHAALIRKDVVIDSSGLKTKVGRAALRQAGLALRKEAANTRGGVKSAISRHKT